MERGNNTLMWFTVCGGNRHTPPSPHTHSNSNQMTIRSLFEMQKCTHFVLLNLSSSVYCSYPVIVSPCCSDKTFYWKSSTIHKKNSLPRNQEIENYERAERCYLSGVKKKNADKRIKLIKHADMDIPAKHIFVVVVHVLIYCL